MSSGASYVPSGVWGNSPSNVFAVGDAGTILHYNGSAWSATSSGTAAGLDGVWGCSPSDVFAVGWEGTIMHYNGSAWSAMSSGTTEGFSFVWGSSSSDVFTVGWNGTILHYWVRTPVMTSVSPISATQTQTITIQGQGFGQQSPYNGDSPYLKVSDLNGGWEAGYSVHGNAVTLNVTSWSDTQIVISGFTGSYGQMGWVLHVGDSIQIKVWNAPSLDGPATYTITTT